MSFPHLVVPIEESFADGLVDLVHEMHALSDGEVNALEYAPLLIAFRGLEGKRTTSLSGAGGEIARGFYNNVLRVAGPSIRGIPLQAFLHKVTRSTGILAPALREEVFPDPLAPTSRVLAEMIEKSSASSPEAILDDIYLRARMQRFAGRNFTTTGLFCRQGLPYFGNELVGIVRDLPISEKQGGRAARNALIQARSFPGVRAPGFGDARARPPSGPARPFRSRVERSQKKGVPEDHTTNQIPARRSGDRAVAFGPAASSFWFVCARSPLLEDILRS